MIFCGHFASLMPSRVDTPRWLMCKQPRTAAALSAVRALACHICSGQDRDVPKTRTGQGHPAGGLAPDRVMIGIVVHGSNTAAYRTLRLIPGGE